jgi:SpoVK/Ycf46/Vps4 family AAA+-type ATPase
MEGLSAGEKSSTDSEEKDEEAEQKRQAEADERRANFRIEDSASYKKLEELVGLESVKKDVLELSSLMKMQVRRKRENLPEVPVSLHLVFAGNPGTGKTTIARILAEIYRDIGVLSKGQLVEVDRSGLVAGYVGQTAIKTREKIEEAKGGILFIDEAYTLSRGENDFGQEAIDTVLKAMEDMRDDFIVIVAGYTELMEGFIDSNPGLESRFNKYIFFPDYTADELIRIFSSMCKKYGYELTEDAKPILEEKIRLMEENKGENFANARDVRNLFEKIVTNQAKRLASLPEEDIRIITASDITGEEEKPKGDPEGESPEGENPEGKSPEGESPEGESPEGGEKTGEDGETTMLREENASAQPTGSSENS